MPQKGLKKSDNHLVADAMNGDYDAWMIWIVFDLLP